MAFVPGTIVKLCNVPIDMTQSNQIRFTTRAAQTAYFASVATHAFTAFTYQRKDNIIRVPAHIDTLWDSNYVMYDNVNFTDRYFYAFIERLEYINDSTTAIHIVTDVYQTWMLDCTLKNSFVVREHETTDTIGINCVDEGLETGEYVRLATTRWTELDDLAVIVGVSETNDTTPVRIAGRVYNGVFSGLGYFSFFGSGGMDALRAFISSYDIGKAAAIVTMFTFPSALLPSGTVSGEIMAADGIIPTVITKSVSINSTTLNGYTVKNKKLMCWPYNYLHATNLQGQSMDYHLEKFHGGYPSSLSFDAKGCIIPGAKVSCYAEDYKINDEANYEDLITLSNYPLCNWTSSAWDNWIAQNAIGIAAGAGAAALSIGTGVATAQPLAVAGGAAAVFSQLSTIYQKYIEPPHVQGNLNNSTVNIAMRTQHFAFNQVQITAEFAQIIDAYFDMYGYKQNKVKTPNVSSRPYWNYVKTVDCNITGPIPAQDMTELKNIYNKGVTIWHAAGNVANYSLDNH